MTTRDQMGTGACKSDSPSTSVVANRACAAVVRFVARRSVVAGRTTAHTANPSLAAGGRLALRQRCAEAHSNGGDHAGVRDCRRQRLVQRRPNAPQHVDARYGAVRAYEPADADWDWPRDWRRHDSERRERQRCRWRADRTRWSKRRREDHAAPHDGWPRGAGWRQGGTRARRSD